MENILLQVREILRSGHIFLNTSLTEAYCMAIVEAASCGLQVVSTRVGGIPEVLPPNLIHLTDATVDSLHRGLLTAIQKLQTERSFCAYSNKVINNHSSAITMKSNHNGILNNAKTGKHDDSPMLESKKTVLCPYECNEILRRLYNWNDITERTESVYQRVLKERDPPFGVKLTSYLSACIPFVLIVSFSYLLLKLLDIIEPRKNIDVAVETQGSHMNKYKRKKL